MSTPRPLDELRDLGASHAEALPDGRFVYIAEPDGGFDPHLHIVLNLDAELERLQPETVAASR